MNLTNNFKKEFDNWPRYWLRKNKGAKFWAFKIGCNPEKPWLPASGRPFKKNFLKRANRLRKYSGFGQSNKYNQLLSCNEGVNFLRVHNAGDLKMLLDLNRALFWRFWYILKNFVKSFYWRKFVAAIFRQLPAHHKNRFLRVSAANSWAFFVDFAQICLWIKILAFKNQPDFIFSGNFQVCIKRMEFSEFLKFFFCLYDIFCVPDINLLAAAAAAEAFSCSVICSS